MEREKVMKALEICADKQCFLESPQEHCPYEELQGSYENLCDECTSTLAKDAFALLKKQGNEEERILKIVWDVLHGCVSTDTVEDQDYVYDLIRNRVHQMY